MNSSLLHSAGRAERERERVTQRAPPCSVPASSETTQARPHPGRNAHPAGAHSLDGRSRNSRRRSCGTGAGTGPGGSSSTELSCKAHSSTSGRDSRRKDSIPQKPGLGVGQGPVEALVSARSLIRGLRTRLSQATWNSRPL